MKNEFESAQLCIAVLYRVIRGWLSDDGCDPSWLVDVKLTRLCVVIEFDHDATSNPEFFTGYAVYISSTWGIACSVLAV